MLKSKTLTVAADYDQGRGSAAGWCNQPLHQFYSHCTHLASPTCSDPSTKNEEGATMEKQSKMVTENEAQLIDEVREVRERAKDIDYKIIKAKKNYTIELTFDELQFLRNAVNGIHEFIKCLHGERTKNNSVVMYQLFGDIELEDIDLEELENKIYIQFFDDDGNIKEPEDIIDLT